jgi:hypothetical protein
MVNVHGAHSHFSEDGRDVVLEPCQRIGESSGLHRPSALSTGGVFLVPLGNQFVDRDLSTLGLTIGLRVVPMPDLSKPVFRDLACLVGREFANPPDRHATFGNSSPAAAWPILYNVGGYA